MSGMTTGRTKVAEAALDALAVLAGIEVSERVQIELIDRAVSVDVQDDPLLVEALELVRLIKLGTSIEDAQGAAIRAEQLLVSAIKLDFSDMSLAALRKLKAEELERIGKAMERLRELNGELSGNRPRGPRMRAAA